LVELAESVVEDLDISPTSPTSAQTPKFSIESGVIVPLWAVGNKCRNKAIRQRAIAVLLNYPRREGIWDSRLAGNIVQCKMDYEEEHRMGDEIPGWARIRSMSFELDHKRRAASLECQQRTSEFSEPVTRRKTICPAW